ncbi:integrase catalytic domain-containing protein [Trichonephila clavipes]|nr:integrase catalytic domain-containing protein [Trichonephila clavipes]
MNFLKQEVQNDEMVELARNNFSAPVNQKKKEVNKPDKFPSAATLSEEIVYRHCRMVFVVSSHPFLLAAVLAHLLENVPTDYTQLGSKLKLSFYVDNCVTGVNDIAQQKEFILRLVAWVLRFLNNVRSRISDRKKEQLSLDEFQSAEIQLIRSVHAQSFTDEKLISHFSVFRDDNNIIRVKTRITEHIDAPNFLSPILLPNNCIFTQRLAEHFYLKNHHTGTQLLLSIIHEKYWIIGGRKTVRNIWNVCVKCRRFKSKSLMTDPVSLPSDRVKYAVVFEVVDVDLAGPMYVKRGDKVWIVLYTCAIYHALHLELVERVSSFLTDAFLLSFRRFVTRRGRPRIIYSDNGTNFRGAYNELVDIDWNEVSRYAEIQCITWKFIPSTAAWRGAFVRGL